MICDKFIHIKQGADPDRLILIDDYTAYGVRVPKGFEWDGASSPRTPFARMAAPKFHRNIKASCLHDFLCSVARNETDRKRADKLYKRMLEEVEGVGWLKANLGYAGVRIGAFFGIGNRF